MKPNFPVPFYTLQTGHLMLVRENDVADFAEAWLQDVFPAGGYVPPCWNVKFNFAPMHDRAMIAHEKHGLLSVLHVVSGEEKTRMLSSIPSAREEDVHGEAPCLVADLQLEGMMNTMLSGDFEPIHMAGDLEKCLGILMIGIRNK